MRAQVIPVGTGERAVGTRDRAGGRLLMTAGEGIAAVAAIAYLAAIAGHPMAAMLKGFDLQVYLGGARQALHSPNDLYTWSYDGHPGIQFTYPPFVALLFTAGLALQFATLTVLITVVSVLVLCATVAVSFGELGWRGIPRVGATLLIAGLALWTEPAQRVLFLGQVELVLMALVTWDLCQPDERRWKGAATGLAAGIKLVPLLFIAYLLLTRRFRQAAVAAVTFAVTVAAGFIAFPAASVTWWLDSDFLEAERTGFVGGQQNQSLRGLLARLAGSVHASQAPWLVLAVLVALTGLAAAAALHRRGLTFAGFMTCALTALLISPVSWDYHWVWIAPGLALAVDAGRRARPAMARAAWCALAAVIWVTFAAWPHFWSGTAGLLQGGLIGYAPATAWAYGDNLAYAEYHWHGLQLLTGNLELLVGLAAFAVLLAVAFRRRQAAQHRDTHRDMHRHRRRQTLETERLAGPCR